MNSKHELTNSVPRPNLLVHKIRKFTPLVLLVMLW